MEPHTPRTKHEGVSGSSSVVRPCPLRWVRAVGGTNNARRSSPLCDSGSGAGKQRRLQRGGCLNVVHQLRRAETLLKACDGDGTPCEDCILRARVPGSDLLDQGLPAALGLVCRSRDIYRAATSSDYGGALCEAAKGRVFRIMKCERYAIRQPELSPIRRRRT